MRDRVAMMLRPLVCGWIPRAVLLLTVAFSFGCNRNHNGQLPQSSGEPVAVAKEPVKGFVLVRAYPDQHDGELALALEFSQPLAATQEFDTLVRLEQGSGNHDGGWSLSDDAKTLRYPYVEADKHYTVLISGDLLAATGSRLGKSRKEPVYTGELDPVVGFASREAFFRRAAAVVCRLFRSTFLRWMLSLCACAKRRYRHFWLGTIMPGSVVVGS